MTAQQQTIGIDLAKNVFQVHAIDEGGKVFIRRQLRRADVLKFFSAQPSSLVGMEACAVLTPYNWAILFRPMEERTMARKRHPDEDILMLLRGIEVRLASGSDVSPANP